MEIMKMTPKEQRKQRWLRKERKATLKNATKLGHDWAMKLIGKHNL